MNNRHTSSCDRRTFPSSQPAIFPDVPQSDWRAGLINFEGGIDPGGWRRDARAGEVWEEGRYLWGQASRGLWGLGRGD